MYKWWPIFQFWCGIFSQVCQKNRGIIITKCKAQITEYANYVRNGYNIIFFFCSFYKLLIHVNDQDHQNPIHAPPTPNKRKRKRKTLSGLGIHIPNSVFELPWPCYPLYVALHVQQHQWFLEGFLTENDLSVFFLKEK